MKMQKRVLLSLATVMMLGSQLGATDKYLPLTSETNDNRWVLFGMNGYKLDGVVAGSVNFTSGWPQLTDNTVDDNAVSGLPDGGGNDMAEVKVLPLPSGALSQITVAADTADITYSETEPTRTMYIKAGGNDFADVYFKYKASLEGKTLEFQVNGDSTKTYTVTISALNTYDNPATRVEKSLAGGSSGTLLNTINLAMDYDLLDNPQDANAYARVPNAVSSVGYQTANANAIVRMYRYNALNAFWEIYDSRNSALANDFEDLKLGMGHWARVDLDNSGSSNAVTRAGLVVSDQGLTASDYNLAEGWNLLSFDELKPKIRTADTGLLVQNNLAAGDIALVDFSGTKSVTVTLGTTSTTDNAKRINLAIEGAKSRGAIPYTFDLRAYAVDASHLLLLSNKKFSVQDLAGADNIGTATTMGAQNVWDIATSALADYSAGNVNTTGISSVYGEYALAIKPLVGPGSAADLDNTVSGGGTNRSAKVQINENTPVHLAGAVDDTVSSLNDAATNIKADTAIANTVAFDFDYNGTNDYLLVVGAQPFYIRDYTFTRVMTYDGTNAGNTFKINSPTTANITTAATIGATQTNINAVADAGAATDTGVYAAVDGSKLVFVTAVTNANNFNIYDDVVEDYLTDATSTNSVAQGAVQEVYSVDYLSQHKVITRKIVINPVSDAALVASDTVQVDINGLGATVPAVNYGPNPTTSAAAKALFDTIADEIRAELRANGIDGTVTHTYTSTDDTTVVADMLAATIVVEGYGITSVDLVNADGANHDPSAVGGSYTYTDPNSATAGTLDTPQPDLTANLKYNAVYTPDFATEGPLYTLKGLGYTAKAMVTGTTFMSNGTVSWDNIDLTKPADEWFAYQDYNLFRIDGMAGYWTYLEPNVDTNNLAIANTVYRPTYVTHFNNDGTTYNTVATTLQVAVTGLPTNTTPVSVYANIGGSKVELASSANNGIYAASASAYEVDGLSSGSIYDVTTSIADGTGYTLNAQTVASIDLQKPVTPTVTLGNGTAVEFASASTDAKSVYVFDKTNVGAIPEENPRTSSLMVGKVLLANGAYNLCADAATFGTEYTYRAVAVDGEAAVTGAAEDGELGFGNASDQLEFTFSAALKGADLLTNTEGVDAGATSLGMLYDESCVGNADTVNAGVSVKSIVADTTVKLAYQRVANVSFSTDTPYTIYVSKGSAALAEIKYIPQYAGKTFYIELEGQVYQGTFPNDDTVNGSTANPLDVSGTLIANQTL